MHHQNKKHPATIASLPEEKIMWNIALVNGNIWLKKQMHGLWWTMSKRYKTSQPNYCHEVTTLHFKRQALLLCQKRNDQIGKEVALRVRSCNNMIAGEHVIIRLAERITFINPEKNIVSWRKKIQRSLLGSRLGTKSCWILIS